MTSATINANRPEFCVVIERDEDGCYVGEAPQLRACYSQGRTVDELTGNMRDVIVMCLKTDSGKQFAAVGANRQQI